MDCRSNIKVVLLLFLVFLSLPACTDSQKEAREKLEAMQVAYNGDAFVQRAAAGDLKTVQLFLTAGMEANARNQRGATPLMAAAGKGQGPVVKLLLENGADVDAQTQEKSVMKKRGKILKKKLVQYGGTPLMQAARNGHRDVVLLLLDKGADLEARDDKEERTALLWAVYQSRNATIKALLDKGASLGAKDKQGRNLLMTAVMLAKPDTLTLLLDRPELQKPDAEGKPLLRYAAAAGRTDNLKLLLAHGEAINARDKEGRTALMWAAGAGKKDAAKLLLELGADAEARDQDGKRALDLAKSDDKLMELLFQAESAKSSPEKK